eukprot:CAMPEP_0119514402 /NCGR_PEP_ID=MMETSP1344-20130328/32243_1 /TAXON_ID=236787 /ORGANISM="Florenciella parvula, Strain CCMP2471" /LENGTH=38 /DNA_ID= /DNA_START= /DNA_END= /DNA_ORIENTATION=
MQPSRALERRPSLSQTATAATRDATIGMADRFNAWQDA